MELVEQVEVKVDSKGRICIPAEIREEIGENATIKRVPEGFLLIPGKKEDPLKNCVNLSILNISEQENQRIGHLNR